MLGGIIIGITSSAIWITMQITWMHLRPAKSRIRAMTTGYLLSIPLIPLLWWSFQIFLPHQWEAMVGEEHWSTILVQAAVSHLLIFFCYVEGFYHVERAVTLRILIEIENAPGGKIRLQELQKDYHVGDMVERRLQTLSEHGYISQNNEGWQLRKKGLFFAKIMSLSLWIFNSKTQDERL